MNQLHKRKKNDKKAIKFGNNISVRVLNDDLNLIVKSRLQKWHYECLILTPKYKAELNRGIAYRIRQRQAGHRNNVGDTKNIFK